MLSMYFFFNLFDYNIVKNKNQSFSFIFITIKSFFHLLSFKFYHYPENIYKIFKYSNWYKARQIYIILPIKNQKKMATATFFFIAFYYNIFCKVSKVQNQLNYLFLIFYSTVITLVKAHNSSISFLLASVTIVTSSRSQTFENETLPNLLKSASI